MRFDLFRKIVDECSGYNIKGMSLYGFGEPFLDPGFIEKIRYAKDKGIENVYVSTNGYSLTKEKCREVISSGLDKIGISFYGKDKKEYEAVFRTLNYETTLQNIRNFIEEKRRAKSRKPLLYIKGLRHCQVGPSSARFFGYPVREIFHLPDIGFRLRWRRHAKTRMQGGERWRGWVHEKDCAGVRHPAAGRDACNDVCDRMVQILWNGDVVPCNCDFDGTLKFGNVSGTEIASIWNRKEYKRFREIKNYNNALNEIM